MLSFKEFLESSIERMRKVRNLYNNPGTPGEKEAAGAALKKMKDNPPKDSLMGKMNKVGQDYKGNMFS
jgi:hypothetical protein